MSIYNPQIHSITTALASGIRTSTQTITSAGLLDKNVGTSPETPGMIAYLNVTQASGTGGLSLSLQEIDPISGATNVVLATLNNTGTGLIKLKIKSAIAAIAPTSTNAQAQDILPPRWQLQVIHGDASNYTYSLGIVLYA